MAAACLAAALFTAGGLTNVDGSASAAPGDASISSAPPARTATDGSTTTTLDWTISTPAVETQCELTRDGNPIAAYPAADCSSGDVSFDVTSWGAYTLTVTPTVGNGATSSVSVVPTAVELDSAPTSPGNDRTPTWTFSALAAADSVECTLTGPAGSVVDDQTSCTSPYTAPDLSGVAPADGGPGTYHLAVVQTGDGQASDPLTSAYAWQPPAPTVTADASLGYSRSPTFTVGNLDGAATTTCTLDPPSGGPAVSVAACGASTKLDLTGGDDGTYTVHVRQSVNGVTSDPASATYTLDTHIPSTPTVSASSSFGTGPHATFMVGNIDPDAQAECTVTGPSAVPNSAVTCASPQTAVDLSGLAAGTYTLSVVERDTAGRDGPAATATYEYLPTAPPAPEVTPATRTDNVRSPQLSVTDAENATLTYSCTVTGPSPVANPDCSSGSPTLDLSGAADGTYTLHVTATDSAGQTSSAGTATYTLDTFTPDPTVTLTSPATSPGSVTAVTFLIGDSESGDTLTCTWSGPATNTSGPCPPGGGFVASGGSGVYTLTVTAKDQVGNTTDSGGNPARVTATYVLDNSTPAPVVTLTSASSPNSPPGADASSSQTASYSIVDSEATSGPDTFDCVWTGPGSTTVHTPGCSSGAAFTASGGEGYYHLTVTATDTLGNSASTSKTYLFDATTGAPVVSLNGPWTEPLTTTTPSFSFSDPAEVLDGPDTYTCDLVGPDHVDAGFSPCASGPITTAGHGGDGAYTLTVAAMDALGNVDTSGGVLATTSYPFTVDTTTPDPTVTVNTALSSHGTANVVTPSISISDSEAGDTLTCTWTDPHGTTVFSGACPQPWTIGTDGIDGTYVLTVDATDQAGNTTDPSGHPASTTISYTYDGSTPKPVLSLTTPVSPHGVGTSKSPTFSISDSETTDLPETLTCGWVDPHGVVTTAPCPSGGTFSAGAGDGTYTLMVDASDSLGNATDPAGNPATAMATYTLDATTPDPTVTLITPVSSAGTATTTSPQFSIIDNETLDGPDTLVCTWTTPGPIASATTTPCPPNGIFAATSGDGTYTLTVTATDALGNSTDPAGHPASASATYTLDATTPDPVVSLLTPLSLAGTANSKAPVFAISDGESADGPSTLGCTWTAPGGSTISAGTCPANGTFPAMSGDGTYTLTVTATDALGNVLDPLGKLAQTTATYTLDATTFAPVVTLFNPTSSPGNVKKPAFTFTDAETVDVPETFSCTWVGPDHVTISSGACTSGQTFPTSGHGDGAYTLTVTASDALGNAVDATGNPTVTVFTYLRDTTTPDPTVTLTTQASLTSPAPPTSTVKNPVYSITDSEAVDGPDTLTCSWTTPGPSPVTTTGVCPANGRFAATAGDGTYTLTVTAQDALGNTVDGAGNPASTTVTYTLDTATPSPTVSLASGTSPSTNTDPAFTITDAESVDPPETYLCDWIGPNGIDSGASPCTSGADFPTAGHGGDGVYTLTVTATDALGNTTDPVTGRPASTTVAYTLDTATPVPTVALTAGEHTPSNNTSPAFAFSSTDAYDGPDTYACVWVGPDGVNTGPASCASGDHFATAGHGGDGRYVLTVTATDKLGNSATSAPFVYSLDTSTPVPVVAQTAPVATVANSLTPTFSLTDAETQDGPDTFTCNWVGPSGTAVSNAACTDGVVLPASAGDGVYTLTVTAIDTVGNTASAAPLTYTLDTTPPLPPIVTLNSATRSSIATGYWTWQYAYADTDSAEETASCTVTGPGGWTQTVPGCAHELSVVLGGGDGAYVLTVTLTDEADNSTSSVAPTYNLDSTAPAGPVVRNLNPRSGEGRTRHPSWTIVVPPGSDALCTLIQGGRNGTRLIVDEQCPKPAQFSLAGRPDGQYTLRVVAYDKVGNVSAPAWGYYLLAPDAPKVLPPADDSSPAVWTVRGNPTDSNVCTLEHGGKVVSAPRSCGNNPTYDMRSLPDGTYTLSVYQVGVQGLQGPPGTASWHWSVRGSTQPPPRTQVGPGDRKRRHPGPTRSGQQQTIVPPVRGHPHLNAGGDTGPPLNIHLPLQTPDRISKDVVQAVRGVVHTVGRAGGGTGFPLLLLGLVMLFLLAQNRIDRRDPKLASASIAADDLVEFEPPPSQREDTP
ncbi:MAG TPA: hypothetical protein VMH41_00690 [Mycobacteriales bacterium]|nr:hypothetical protein [Mycobacteriales bacterium]